MNEEPLTPMTESESRPVAAYFFDFVEMLAWSMFAVLIVFTFAVRLCRVDGASMESTLKDRESLLLYSFAYTPKQDDIVVFHLTDAEHDLEKTLVKRVIATGGQTVEINTKTKTITVDGVVYEDTYSILHDSSEPYRISGLFFEHYDPETGIFKASVPEGHLFVMGDNRNNSKDSRNPYVGFVDERCVLGKVVLRIAPFTVFN